MLAAAQKKRAFCGQSKVLKPDVDAHDFGMGMRTYEHMYKYDEYVGIQLMRAQL